LGLLIHLKNKGTLTGDFHTISLPNLVFLTLAEIRKNRFMGIPGSLFYRPQKADISLYTYSANPKKIYHSTINNITFSYPL